MTISVRLRPAGPDDRRPAWEWMCRSDVTPSMMGPPTFADHEVPDFDEFCADWLPHFWSDSQPELGRAFVIVAGGEEVGVSAYNDICMHSNGRKFTELDTWLRSEAHCGVGHGTQAMKSLCKLLCAQQAVGEVFVQVSSRNQRSIRAHEKAGFVRVGLALDEAARRYQTCLDHRDSVFMAREL